MKTPFSYELARSTLSRSLAGAKFRSQKVDEWHGRLPLPGPVIEYYRDFGPVNVLIEGYGNPYFLPSLADLWDFQKGYRYLSSPEERLSGWDDDWLVIADEGGDAFIFSMASHSIMFAHHGEGTWSPEPIFDSLLDMTACFSVLGEIVSANFGNLTDNDSMLIEEHVQKAHKDLAGHFGSESKAEHALMLLGWSN
jgi:hypothetical protein